MFHTEFSCPSCDHHVAYCSRRRGFFEKYVLPVFLLRPYRCGGCFRRSYRTIFLKARKRLGREGSAASSSAAASSQRVA
jgi:predicted metal-binding protein